MRCSRSLFFLLLLALHAQATPPVLYAQPALQSPIRGEPDDLLLLPGLGFAATDSVYYRVLEHGNPTPDPPSMLPLVSTAAAGIAPIVSTQNVPYSLTVLLPQAMQSNRTYELRVRSAGGEWSNAVKINDARPLWLSPTFVYSSSRLASLPRYLKIVGRNLQASPNAATHVKLSGPTIVTLQAESDSVSVDHFVARVLLPPILPLGEYRVRISRDSESWVDVPQTLQVRADPATPVEFAVADARFGGCRANDAQDDSRCVLRAIAAAERAGGGKIVFDAGDWDLISGEQLESRVEEGILLPPHIALRGAGADRTRLIRHPQWTAAGRRAAFTLLGSNEIRGFKFKDAKRYTTNNEAGAFLRIGRASTPDGDDARLAQQSVADVVVTQNVFDNTMIAIADAGQPIEKLFITYSEFGAYHAALQLGGNRFSTHRKFRLDDSIIAFNVFKPGGWLEPAARQGALASELGAGYRVDFSDNIADGAAVDYLYDARAARGWRAAFFWHMNNNQELLLVSKNKATCTGDKVGDGEAIAYDNNGNTHAFDTAKEVLAASDDSVTVAGPLLATQFGTPVPTDSFYIGHWLQVGQGPGIGQVRKILSYSIDNARNRVTFKIAPRWDVAPDAANSRISVGREFWQVYTIANEIDHRQPLCLKSNRSDKKGGGISLWAQTADSAVAGNRQFDTDGITFLNLYSEADSRCADCNRGTSYFNFVEIRGNAIDGEYDWRNDCSSSGILGTLAAAPRAVPTTVNYGVTIAHNSIRQADAQRGGAIALTPSWYMGPPPHRWPLIDSTLIYHNSLLELWSDRARNCGKLSAPPRTGINLGASSLVWRPVLYANSCGKIPVRTHRAGAQHVAALCKATMQDACECDAHRP